MTPLTNTCKKNFSSFFSSYFGSYTYLLMAKKNSTASKSYSIGIKMDWQLEKINDFEASLLKHKILRFFFIQFGPCSPKNYIKTYSYF